MKVNVFICLFSSFFLKSILSEKPTSQFLGISPQDMEYYLTEKIKCKDGTKFFSKERLNDGYCDCPDGTDEPGTSACPESKFYCRNGGQVPLFLFSSRVNDRICDCCDGTDEYDGLVSCPNTCRLDTSTQNREPDVVSEVRKMVDITVPQHSVKLDDLILKFKNLKTLLLLEIILLGWGLVSFVHYQCAKNRRRRHQ